MIVALPPWTFLLPFLLRLSTGNIERERSNDALSSTLKKDDALNERHIDFDQYSGNDWYFGCKKTSDSLKQGDKTAVRPFKGHTVIMEWNSDWTSTILRRNR